MVWSGVLNSFLTVTTSVHDSSCPRIASAGVGLGWPNGDGCVLFIILQPLLLVQPLQALRVACRCCQGFGEHCPFSPGSFLPSRPVCPQLEPGWSCRVPSLGVGRDWEAAGSGDGEKKHMEVLGAGRSWALPGASLDWPFRGAGPVPGHRGAAAAGPAEPAPVALLRSHIRRDGVSWETLGEAKAPWADQGQGSSWCHPAAEKPISISGSESGAGSPAGSLAVSGVGRKQAELDGTCDLYSEPMQAPGALPTSQATPLRPQLANELRARSAGEGRVLEPADEPHALSLHLER